MSLPESMILTKDMTIQFGKFVAVNHVNLDVKRGEIFGFLGPNGAGKTTTERMLCGLLTPTDGSIQVAGYDMVKEPEAAKTHLGYMPQAFSLYDDLKIWENLEFFSGIYQVPKNIRKERIEAKLELMQLLEYKNRITGNLSGGMKQRVSLACALVHEPPLLFLDEPTAGVDPALRAVFWTYFNKIKQSGVTIFVNTHYMDEALQCDRLGLMNRGRLLMVDTPDGLKERVIGGQAVDLWVSPSDSAKTLDFLKGYSLVKRAEPIEDKLRLIVTDSDAVVLELPEMLEKAGIRPLRIRPVTITLDDVFIKLIDTGPDTRHIE
jgi:ABC-2 type transport system ATP-binding protein